MSRLKEIALELLRKYEISKSCLIDLIDERSIDFERDEKRLSKEIAKYYAEIQEQEHDSGKSV